MESKLKRSLHTALLAIVMSSFVASCASTQLGVTYQPPSKDGAALLISEDNLDPVRMLLIGGNSIYPLVVDADPIKDAAERGAQPLALRPGPHRVLIRKRSGSGSGVLLVEFDARAGETYFVRHRVDKADGLASVFDTGRWYVWIEDKNGNHTTEPSEIPIRANPQPLYIPIFVPKGK
jgi:hypothetical protein